VPPYQKGEGGIVSAAQEPGKQFAIGHTGTLLPRGGKKVLDEHAHRAGRHRLEPRRLRFLLPIPFRGGFDPPVLTTATVLSNTPTPDTASVLEGCTLTVAAYVRVGTRSRKDDGQRTEIKKWALSAVSAGGAFAILATSIFSQDY
jgi:hypothetical protein